MATNLLWPEWALIPQAITPFHVVPTNTSGGRSSTGSEQIIGTSPGRGRVELRNILVNTEEEERLWRTIALNLRGRAGVIMVPALSRRTAPWPTIGQEKVRSGHPVEVTDEVLFSDGSALFTKRIDAEAAASVAAGATSMTIRLRKGSTIKSGQIFQVGECAYPISRVTGQTGDNVTTVFTCQLGMPVRVAISDAAVLNFDNPRFRARLADDTAMPIDLEMHQFGSSSLAFVEDV